MPNKDTFSIEPIAALVMRYASGKKWADPFCGLSPFKRFCVATNDLNPEIEATHHMESLEFLQTFGDAELDGVFFDPPYSPRQIAEVYKSIGINTQTEDTQSAFWGDRKREIARIVRPGGFVISCGWNSNGIGYSNFFQPVEVLIIAHGGWHNDTILWKKRYRFGSPRIAASGLKLRASCGIISGSRQVLYGCGARRMVVD